MISQNRAKIAAAAAKRRAKINKVKAASTTSGWVVDKVTKKSNPVINELRQWMIDSVNERNRDRDTAHIHPSEISKNHWCPRQTFYRISDVEPDEEKKAELYWRLASIFEEGHDIHAKHQRGFWEMGTLEGAWVCLVCEHKWWAIAPAVCASCASLLIEYAEVPVAHPEYHMIGHTDGLRNDGTERTNLEVKSIGIRSIEIEVPGIYKRWAESGASLDALWASIKIPFPSHQRQALLYMALLNYMGYHVTETLFIYEFKANQELKGFIVKYDERRAQQLLNKAAAVLAARDSGVTPDRPDWAGPKVTDCKDCPWSKRCWSTDEVQTQGVEA